MDEFKMEPLLFVSLTAAQVVQAPDLDASQALPHESFPSTSKGRPRVRPERENVFPGLGMLWDLRNELESQWGKR